MREDVKHSMSNRFLLSFQHLNRGELGSEIKRFCLVWEPNVYLVFFARMHAVFHYKHLVSVELRDLDLCTKRKEVCGNQAISYLGTGRCDEWRVVCLVRSRGIGGGNYHDFGNLNIWLCRSSP